MGGLSWEALEPAIRANRTRTVMQLCLGASEAQRRTCAKPVMALARNVWDFRGDHDAALLAALACGPFTSLRKHALEFSGIDTTAAYDVLVDRDPDWLAGLASAILASADARYGWLLVRRLVRDGRIERPDHPAYIARMVIGLRLRTEAVDGKPERGPQSFAPVYERLLADPALLHDEVYRLPTNEDACRRLGGWEPDHPEGWAAALLRLAGEGRVDRIRLLGACLDGFLSDIAPSALGWNVRMWKGLDPTLDEQELLVPRLVRVVAADASIGASFAVDALAKLHKADRLSAGALSEALPAALSRTEKGTVVAALRLLDRSRLPADDVVRIAAVALASARTDVQSMALGMIEKRAGASAIGEIGGELESVAPALAPRASALRGTKVTVGVTRQVTVPPPLDRYTAMTLGPPAPGPVAGLDELVDLLVVALEEADDPVALERALEGVVRLGDRVPPASLVARAGARLEQGQPFVGGDPRDDLAAVVAAWSGRRPWKAPDRTFERPHATHAVSASRDLWGLAWEYRVRPTLTAFPTGRFWEAASAAATRRGTYLSLPTRVGGWIDAAALVERVGRLEADRAEAGHFDAAQAVLRLGIPEDRAALLKAAGGLRSEPGLAVRKALGDPTARPRDPTVERCAAWVAGAGREAERSLRLMTGRPSSVGRWRSPIDSIDVAMVATIDAPAAEVSMADPVSLLTYLAEPLTHFEFRFDEGKYATRQRDVLRLWLPASPATPDLVLAGALPILHAGLARERTAAMGLLAGLLLPGVPLGPAGYLTIVLGASAGAADVRLLATDVVIQAAADGRFDPSVAGDVLGRAVAAGVVKANRVSAVMAEASRSSAVVAYRLAETVELALAGALPAGARDLHLLAEVLTGNLTLLGRSVCERAARSALEAVAGRKGSSRLVGEARRLLALQETAPTPALVEAADQAAAGLAARAGDVRVELAPVVASPAAEPPRRRLFGRR